MSLLTVQEASLIIQQKIPKPLNSDVTETLPLTHATGRTLSQDLYTDRAYPPYDRCMMDGICFSSKTLSTSFTLRGTIHAGGSKDLIKITNDTEKKSFSSLEKSEMTNESIKIEKAWKINTGAPVPPDYDTIVPVEELELTATHATLKEGYTPTPGSFIHKKGSDTPEEHCILPKGTLLNSATLSIAASIGKTQLPVHRLPRVFILTTGTEAVPVEDTPSTYEIRRSHPTALEAALNRLGIKDITFTHLSDDYSEMTSCLQHALSTHDLIITCGAISKGSSDYLKDIFRTLIGVETFHGISERPGKPMAFWGPTDTTPPVFALPGNALSTLVTFHRYVAPAILTLMGHQLTAPTEVTCEHNLSDFHLTRFLPVTQCGPKHVCLKNPQNSGDFSQLAGTDGFVEIPSGTIPSSPATFTFYPWL